MRPISAAMSVLLFLVILFSGLMPVTSVAAETVTIKKLKNLYLTTNLVEKGKAQAVIVVPANDRYRSEVAALNQRIRRISGLTLPVVRDDQAPEELLRNFNVITLGNMSTNAFIGKLYCQWQVILDLKYPGQGGYVVRTLHNPYATGHNVIFLGGSDDEGVSEAVRVFTAGLKKKPVLKVGRLMQIRLGKDFSLPAISGELKKWNVRSWNDSWRKSASGRETGYPTATFFGWNPISIAGVLYYMTGEKKYLDLFKELALPVPGHAPPVNSADDAFDDPSNPLVKTSHYRSHLVDCIYDLIEESPYFSDSERLRITNKLAERQFELDPDSSFSRPSGDRHAMWHMLCIYTGSRYFSRYYPNPLWERRIANVRKAFTSFYNDPTWGGQEDTLYWVATFIEPVFDFALLDGSSEFVKSGSARTLMRGLETLMTGEDDDYNHFLSQNLLFKAALLLKDSRYIWMANRLGADFSGFRIGQSYWPAPETVVKPPLDLIGSVTVTPLSKVDREMVKTPVPAHQAFQVLSYRTGLGRNDDFLLLDGFAGSGRHPFQLNTLLRLRMFNGKNILSGYGSDLSIWRNGMSEPHVARSAALREHLVTKDSAYIHTDVPDMPWSEWQRHIMVLKDRFAIVIDRISPHEAGRFDIRNYWEMGSGIKPSAKPLQRVVTMNGAVLTGAGLTYEQLSPTMVQARVSQELGKNEPVVLASLFSDTASPAVISPLKQGGYLIAGSKPAFVGVGHVSYPSFSVKADFSYMDTERLVLERAGKLVVQGRVVMSSDVPVTLLWNLKEGTVLFSASQAARVSLASAGGVEERVLSAGERTVLHSAPPVELREWIQSALAGFGSQITHPIPKANDVTTPVATWKPVWEHAVKGRITALAQVDGQESGGIWAVNQDGLTATFACFDQNGRLEESFRQQGEVLTIWSAVGEKQSRAFALLAGFRDDSLRAYGKNGKEVWTAKASIHPSFQTGDHYTAPWFTNPGPPDSMTGVYSLLALDFRHTGKEEIAIGRPSTVEFRSLDGTFLSSAPTRWGTNTLLASVKRGAVKGNGPLLLAGKGHAGNPALSGIDGRYTNISDGLYGACLPGFTNMHSWLMRGMAGLRVTDLNGDGAEEVVYMLSGHWNELRVYSADGKPLWMKFFGPDKHTGVPFMTALDVADLTGSGRKEVVVGTKLGWVTAFDHQGAQLWRRHFENGIASLAISEKGRKIVVGCDDGLVALLDENGRQLATGRMNGAVKKVIFVNGSVYAGSAGGVVRRYAVPL